MGTYDPYAHADQMGLKIVFRPLDRRVGFWFEEYRTIVLRQNMSVRRERSVLAHEIVHAEHGDMGCDSRQEVRADRVAAGRLIDPFRLADVMAASPDAGRWAIELGVTPDILRAYFAFHHEPVAELRPAV